MIPTAIVAALALAPWIRWWAIPVVGVVWGMVIAVAVDPSSFLAAVLLGTANALVGTAIGLGAMKLFAVAAGGRPVPRRDPST